MQKNIVILFVLATVTGTASAVFWTCPVGDPNNFWDVASSWSTGVVPVSTDKVQFNNDHAECIVDTAAVSGQMVVGDNGAGGLVQKLRIVAGGSLVTGGVWSASGYNRSSNVTVEEGGSLETGSRFGVGWFDNGTDPQVSYLNVNGGDVLIGGNLEIGRVTSSNNIAIGNHTAIVNVFLGELEVTGNIVYETWPGSLIDVSFGTMIVGGDRTALIADLADNVPANIAAFGGGGVLNVAYDADRDITTITADDPMNASPTMGAIVPADDVLLSWTNKAESGSDVDVWFGTDPNKESGNFTRVVIGEWDTTSVSVNAGVPGRYYWIVEALGTILEEPNSPVYYFDSTDDSPPYELGAGRDMITWKNEPVQLDGTFYDDGKSEVVTTWSSDDPNAVFSPSSDGGVTSNDKKPTVTVDYAAGDVEVTFTVQDAFNHAESDEAIIAVYEDGCEAARDGAGEAANYPGDITGPDGVPDCIITLIDFAEGIAAKWLDPYQLEASKEI